MRFLAVRGRDNFPEEVFLIWRVQGREGRELSREVALGYAKVA